MSEASMLKEFLELVQIPVQSRDERKIADVVKQKLIDLGLTVEEAWRQYWQFDWSPCRCPGCAFNSSLCPFGPREESRGHSSCCE